MVETTITLLYVCENERVREEEKEEISPRPTNNPSTKQHISMS